MNVAVIRLGKWSATDEQTNYIEQQPPEMAATWIVIAAASRDYSRGSYRVVR